MVRLLAITSTRYARRLAAEIRTRAKSGAVFYAIHVDPSGDAVNLHYVCSAKVTRDGRLFVQFSATYRWHQVYDRSRILDHQERQVTAPRTKR